MQNRAEILIGSQVRQAADYTVVKNPYDGAEASRAAICGVNDALDAIETAYTARKSAANAPLHRRIAWLNDAALRIEQNKELYARAITAESAKPIGAARTEVDRCIETIRVTAMEALNLGGELFNTDATPSGVKTLAFYKRVPVGVVAAITPFNFPLNLVAHKMAPALAAGNTMVLKPAPQTPFCGYLLARAFIDSPFATPDALSVVYGDAEVGTALITNELVRKVSFTGSVPVGKIILKNAGLKKVSLELGGNAATYVTKEADLVHAAARCAIGAFGNAGQVCISLQRIYVDADVHDQFAHLLAKEAAKLKVGSCHDAETFISALIDENAARRAKNWIDQAVAAGARVVSGGEQKGAVLTPTVLADVTDEMAVVCEEVFAPIVSLVKVFSADEAFERMNDSPYGLQFSVFTNDLALSKRAMEELECGGVVINDIPTLRFDLQPYGGVKYSGIGREGPKYALEEMTEIRSIVIR